MSPHCPIYATLESFLFTRCTMTPSHQISKPTQSDEFRDVNSLLRIRKELWEYLGSETVRALHQQKLWLDAVLISVLIGVFVSNFVLISTGLVPLPGLLLISLVQGWLILAMPLLGHDLFGHRMAWRRRYGPWLSMLLFLPALRSASMHRIGHARHHAKSLTSEDTEAQLRHINTRTRRFLFATIVGYLLALSGRWFPANEQNGYEALIGATEADHQLVKREKRGLLVFSAITIGLTFADWRVGLFGYWLAIMVFTTLISSFRIIIEHTHVDRSNPYWIGTPYVTGLFSQCLFIADSGDCHIVHHVFPGVPWYHVPKLARLSRPFLESKGVVFEKSIWTLASGWFVHNYPMGTKWPLRGR